MYGVLLSVVISAYVIQKHSDVTCAVDPGSALQMRVAQQWDSGKARTEDSRSGIYLTGLSKPYEADRPE